MLSRTVKSNFLWSHGLQTRLLCPWDFPGKNTGVGCHFLIQSHLLDPGMEHVSHVFPALAGGFFTTAPAGYLWVKFCARPFVSSSLPLIHLYVTISLKFLWKIYVTLSEIVFRHVDPSLWCQCFCSKSSAPMTVGMSLTPGDSVQVGSRSQWESVQGEVCSAQPRPSHILFYPQNTENASLPTTHLPHPKGTWLKSCICWGSIRVRTMNSGFNNCEREMIFCVFSSYIYVSWIIVLLF